MDRKLMIFFLSEYIYKDAMKMSLIILYKIMNQFKTVNLTSMYFFSPRNFHTYLMSHNSLM